MARHLQVEYSHRMKDPFSVEEVDTAYYKTLADVQEKYVNPATGRLENPIPTVDQVLSVTGTTVLSSSSLAKGIKAWLNTHESKITLSILYTDREIEFEGPNLSQSVASIKDMIEAMVTEENASQIRIHAVRTR